MSHVSAVQLEVNDLDALEQACQDIGLELVRGKKTFKWYGQWVKDYHGDDAAYKHGIKPEDYGKCDHAICIPGNDSAYEVGVVARADGSFTLVWDHWNKGQGLEEKIGRHGEKLNQPYAVHRAVGELKKKGFSVFKQTTTEDNKVRIVLRG